MRTAIFATIILLLMCTSVCAGLPSVPSGLIEEIESFIGDDKPIIVQGAQSSKTERILFSLARDKYPAFKGAEIIDESELDSINVSGRTVILIGGPSQNAVSAEVVSREEHVLNHTEIPVGSVTLVISDTGRYVVFSDKAGFAEPGRDLSGSPLAKIMREEYIPIAATGISLFLLFLGRLLFGFFYKAFRLMAADRLMSRFKKKEIRHHHHMVKYISMRIKPLEWAAIISAATVFALSASFYFVTNSSFMFRIVIINISIYSLRHVARLVMDVKHELHTEYKFWIWGGIITVLSGWLGNTFSMAGYIVSDGKKSDKEGHIAYLINLLTFLAFAVLFVFALFSSSQTLRIGANLALAISVIQMLPFRPFSGKKVYEWKKGLWWLSFIPMFACYVGANLII